MDENQNKSYQRAKEGHNLIIVGPPGTGKTYILAHIIDHFLLNQVKVAITSTTGISSCILRDQLHTHLKDIPPISTIHRFVGLKDGRFTDDELLELLQSSEEHSVYRDNILSVQILIIDEISMMSQRILEQLEFVFRHIRGSDKPFSGVQVILAGDFYQLPPIPTPEYGDDGSSIIKCPLMSFFHTEKLHKIHRQTEVDLITAIHDIARGELTEDSHNLLQRLRRPLPPGPPPVKLMSRREDVNICNARALMEMNGEEKVYKSVDEGDVTGIQGEKELHLKNGCPVILLINLSDKLVNGLRGIVTSCVEGEVEVKFEDAGITKIGLHTFARYDRYSKTNIGTRKQIPLTLGYASTIHKSQGSTLERVDIDCKGIFQYGQLAVAVSRAKNKKGLRIQNLKSVYIMKPPEMITTFLSAEQLSYSADKCCCCNSKTTNISHSTFYSESSISEELDEDELLQILMEECDKFVSDITEEVSISFNVDEELGNMRVLSPETNPQIQENGVIDFLQSHKSELQHFLSVVNKNSSSDSLQGKEVLSNKEVNIFYSTFNQFMSSATYKNLARDLFKGDPSAAQFNVSYRLCVAVRKAIVEKLSEPIKESAKQLAEAKKRQFYNVSDSGKGIVRYISGWVVSTLKKRKAASINNLLYNKKRVSDVEKLINQREMLEYLTEQESALIEKTTMPETLHETARRQNLRRGLTNISDSCFNFFLKLDAEVRCLETEENINLHGKNFPEYQYSQVSENEDLKKMFNELFVEFENKIMEENINILFAECLNKFVKMSVTAFKKEYQTEQKIVKKEATRKQIKMRTSKKQGSEIFNMAAIEKDSSEGKEYSHKRLQSECVKNKNFLEENFQKNDLQVLCVYYNVKYTKSMTKKQFLKKLFDIICDVNSMPNTSIQPEPPKKKKIDWPCGACGEEADNNSVACHKCDRWFHGKFVKIDDVSTMEEVEWLCSDCKN